MSILNFVSQEDLDDLDDDSRTAFMTIVDLAQRSLSRQLSSLQTQDDEAGWNERQELQHSFMNSIVAAAKQFEIEPFSSMQVPRLSDYKKNVDHREFKADLDHFITQLVLENSLKKRRDSVGMAQEAKDQIRTYLSGLRQFVETAQMSEEKREALFKRLDGFEEELEKRRVSILAIARLTFELLAVPGGIWTSVEVVNKLIHNVAHTVAEAKLAEIETRSLPIVSTPKALSPPRTTSSPNESSKSLRETLDDDIPF